VCVCACVHLRCFASSLACALCSLSLFFFLCFFRFWQTVAGMGGVVTSKACICRWLDMQMRRSSLCNMEMVSCCRRHGDGDDVMCHVMLHLLSCCTSCHATHHARMLMLMHTRQDKMCDVDAYKTRCVMKQVQQSVCNQASTHDPKSKAHHHCLQSSIYTCLCLSLMNS